MVTDIRKLVELCEDEIAGREYTMRYQSQIRNRWQEVIKWCDYNKITEFNEVVGFMYADETLGTHILDQELKYSDRIRLRAVRMLTSYQRFGDFEFRTPFVERKFSGPIGPIAEEYWLYLRDVLHQSYKTLETKKEYLTDFTGYTDIAQTALDDINTDRMEAFFAWRKYSLASRHNCASCLRNFFHYSYDHGYSEKDNAIFVLSDDYRKNCKLPTTYTEEEIADIIQSVERASSIGKRDYLILLLAAEYGWRAGDIVTFRFDQIDWDRNVIRFAQDKTDVPVEFPLLASVGNAIIDYLKYGRPVTDTPEIIVSADRATLGKPLSRPTIHSVVSRYMRKAGIKNWKEKKHGPHSLRHSLATNMLKKNVTLPVISTVLGHQRTETTKIYLKVDTEKLSSCPLPPPVLNSPYYRKEGGYQ